MVLKIFCLKSSRVKIVIPTLVAFLTFVVSSYRIFYNQYFNFFGDIIRKNKPSIFIILE